MNIIDDFHLSEDENVLDLIKKEQPHKNNWDDEDLEDDDVKDSWEDDDKSDVVYNVFM